MSVKLISKYISDEMLFLPHFDVIFTLRTSEAILINSELFLYGIGAINNSKMCANNINFKCNIEMFD